jgi:hypothetical protein
VQSGICVCELYLVGGLLATAAGHLWAKVGRLLSAKVTHICYARIQVNCKWSYLDSGVTDMSGLGGPVGGPLSPMRGPLQSPAGRRRCEVHKRIPQIALVPVPRKLSRKRGAKNKLSRKLPLEENASYDHS